MEIFEELTVSFLFEIIILRGALVNFALFTMNRRIYICNFYKPILPESLNCSNIVEIIFDSL